MNRKNLIYLLIFTLMKLATSQTTVTTSCDSFQSGTNPARIAAAFASVTCPCTLPCTAEQAAEFVDWYYIKNGMDTYAQFDAQKASESELYRYSGRVKILVHGWANHGLESWIVSTAKKFIEHGFEGIVIFLDYKETASCNWPYTVSNVAPGVGGHIANVVKNLGFNLSNTEIIGHSLGAHVAGHAGDGLNRELFRITGLDPAGPLYDELNKGLEPTDAQFVQVIITQPVGLGSSKSRGHINFYPNRGSLYQPGCDGLNILLHPGCSHDKAVLYYDAALSPSDQFIGVACSSLNETNSADTARFGEYNDNTKMGEYCFKTSACPPYAINN